MAGVYGVLALSRRRVISTPVRRVALLGYNLRAQPIEFDGRKIRFQRKQLQRFNFAEAVDSHTVSASFGRKITGKLAFQVSGGPQILEILIVNWFRRFVEFRPCPGLGTMSVTYGPWPRGVSYSASYAHGLTGGSGV